VKCFGRDKIRDLSRRDDLAMCIGLCGLILYTSLLSRDRVTFRYATGPSLFS